jgi:RNA polymerase sigma-70 factor (ECF subfamily)
MGYSQGYVSNSITRATLIRRLHTVPDDPVAWREFVERYGGKIYTWCRAWGLQEADAQDVTQAVFLNLATRLRNFQYDSNRCFRAWLKTVAHNCWQDFLMTRRLVGVGMQGKTTHDQLERLEARDDLSNRLLELIDEELLDEAACRVRMRIEPRTWNAFRLLAIEGLSGVQVAAQLGMKVATVFVARSKVQKMLAEEIKRLDQG